MERAPVPANAGEIMADVIGRGDLERLTAEQRVAYYRLTCESLGLNPLTKPLDFIRLNGRLVLYATKGATDQLRARHGISVRVVSQEIADDVLVVTVEGTDASGRTDTDIGAVNVAGLRGDALANAQMKALTKGKRRLTLSMAGLGMLDESELETVRDAQEVRVDVATGEIVDRRAAGGGRRAETAETATLRPLPAGPAPAARPVAGGERAAEPAPAEAGPGSAREWQETLQAQIRAAAAALGLDAEGLSERLTAISGKPDRRTWGIEDIELCAEALAAEAAEAALAAVEGEAGDDRYTR